MSFVLNHSDIFRPVLILRTENRHEIFGKPNIYIYVHKSVTVAVEDHLRKKDIDQSACTGKSVRRKHS